MKYKKNQILYNQEIFNKALENLTTINKAALDNKIDKTIGSIDLNLLLTANDKDFSPLLMRYCNKTGTELQAVDIEHLKLLIAVHGKETALQMLKIDACASYSPLWLKSEPKTLNKLMYFDPQGFFIYAASYIFHADIIQKSNVQKIPPMSQAGKESTENRALDDFLAEFPQQDKPTDFEFTDILNHEDVRYFNLQDKIIGNRNLQLYHEPDKLTEINELLRRFLGLANPGRVANMIKFSSEFLYQVTDTPESMETFKQELITAIKQLFETHYKKIKHKKKEGYYIRLRNEQQRLLHSGSIAEVKTRFGGFSHFHNQPNLRNQSTKESILIDLQGFFDEETEKNDILKSFKVSGHSKDFNANSLGLDYQTGEPLNRHTVKKGFKLNLKKPE